MSLCLVMYFFFFSSRRRHTRCSRDWSSDVCSSDLASFVHDPDHRVHRFIEYVVLHDTIETSGSTELVHRSVNPLQHLGRRFALPLQQALDQDPRFARENENGDRVGVRRSNLLRTVYLNVEKNVPPGLKDLLDLTLQRSVEFSSVFRGLDKSPLLPPVGEFLARQEVVRFPLSLARPRPASRRGDRVPEFLRVTLEDGPGDRRLPSPGWRGEHDDPRRHSRFSSCSRNFSSSPFIAITVCVIAASFAFDPIVFASRSSSCERKPSCLPTAPSLARASRHAARCVRSRTSSSVTSTRSAMRAISTASRCSSTCTPPASSATAFLSRASSVASRSGARRSTSRAPASSASSRQIGRAHV